MLGYVRAEKPEMKVKEFEVYNGYYCGVCKSIGESYGTIPRLTLSYDAAFLATLIDGISEETATVSREHCIVHPVKKKTIIRSEAVNYAADTMLLLGYHKLEDDVLDEKKLKSYIGKKIFSSTYKKLSRSYRVLNKSYKKNLEELHEIEKQEEGNLDIASHNFAKIMEETLTYYFVEKGELEQSELRILQRLGYMLGKWIYIIDALDDLEEDIEKGLYNPFIYKLKSEYNMEEYPEESLELKQKYFDKVAEIGEKNLFLYGSDLMNALELLEMKKNRAIIENILGMGLLRKAEEVIEKLKNLTYQSERKASDGSV